MLLNAPSALLPVAVPKRVVITGAFSFTGAAVASELSRRGWTVCSLTNRRRPPGADHIASVPLRFESKHLETVLSAADAFVNTYWLRFPYGGQTFETAVANSKLLIEGATQAGIGRFVHLSVSNAASNSNLGYYRGKAEVEAALRTSRLSYSIVCPTLIVGPRDVLTNNIAWFLRRFPIFPIPDGGNYRLRPLTLGDAGRIVADETESSETAQIDAAGPEIMTFREYVHTVARACGLRRTVVGVPGNLALAALRLVQRFLKDVVLTREELLGLQQEALLSHQSPRAKESVTDWLRQNGETLGRRYANDLDRHFLAHAQEPVLNPGSFALSLGTGRDAR